MSSFEVIFRSKSQKLSRRPNYKIAKLVPPGVFFLSLSLNVCLSVSLSLFLSLSLSLSFSVSLSLSLSLSLAHTLT